MRRVSFAFFAICMALCGEASAQTRKPAAEPLSMVASELALDYKTLIGKRVTVTDCIMVGARLEFAACPIIAGEGVSGMINVGYGKADRAARKRALEECADVKPNRRCVAEVTGKVRGSMTGQVIGLDDATVRFREN